MNYEEEFFRQMVCKNNKSYGGFALLTTLLGLAIFVTYFILKWIVKGVIKLLQDRQEQISHSKAYSRAVSRLLELLEGTNYTLDFNIIKSHTNRSTGELTQHINFVAYDLVERKVLIVNQLLNEVLKDTLTICNSKDPDLKGTIITKNYEIETIQENLRNILNHIVVFRNF